MKKPAADRILMFLKMRGEATSLLISKELSITKEGARKHLLNLAEEGLITSVSKSEGVGRPSTYYTLTEKGLSQFPDSHADVTVQILRSVKNLLGDNALDLLINDREKTTYQRYEKALINAESLEQRLDVLVKVRSEEGYMAEWTKEDGAYFLIENHCPICAAAAECQGFCRAELSNFQNLIGKAYQVERVNHILSGGQRCVYKIT
ncbi:transcriptional regulator [Chryseobacterium carnipullorum]|uniref:Transcriptional regulator n=1 Tax=Chryseobacterium carnipullorum TaxID=1124835 RepID=A0A376E2E1_CHRCU|nr:metalloregulator ArsR/SmtB family transcription factor [Chryseobacterium carnipullorum]AZA50600.1 transcriptional regulator [Chryseobacterium carnipullorum]AZA65466.1 transcriptional regulator [Chryseobacterium carnipullorum]STD00785.1 iron-sulfur cluster biosynthesis transcriptional regulator SufR [Chryseobacterium carnipullorum]